MFRSILALASITVRKVRPKINVPAALLIFLIFLGSQTLLLLGLYDAPIGATDRQFFVLWVGVLLHAILGLLGMLIILGTAGARLPSAWRSVIWILALVGSTLFFWEAIAYNMIGLHLVNATRLLWENVFTDKQIMRERTGPMLAIAAGYALVSILGPMLCKRLERRWRLLAWECSPRPLLTALALALVVVAATQMVLRLKMDSRVYRASVERLTGVGRIFHTRDIAAGALFEVREAWFKPPPRPETHDLETLHCLNSNSLPDIFIVVSDSVRRDVITPEVAPHLNAFGRACLPIGKTVANANGTHPSLTAIIHGLHPLYHGVYFQREDYPGALPLRVLKKLGYEINVLASPDLEYFKFAKAAFATNHALADFYLDQKGFAKARKRPVGELDRLIVTEAIARLSRKRDRPRFFFLLLDSTHFEYSWAAEFVPPFRPYAERVPAVPAGLSAQEIEALRNRYKNSVAYMDTLMGELLAGLRRNEGFQNSIFIFTGDHGEEFMERGHLFHGGELNHYQLEVPLLIHLPPNAGRPAPSNIKLASHVDIFPTIFDSMGVSGPFTADLSGNSLLGSNAPPWEVSVISGWGKKWFPIAMAIDAGDRKLMLQFRGSRVLGRSLYAERFIGTGMVDAKDNEIQLPASARTQPIPAPFRAALESLLITMP